MDTKNSGRFARRAFLKSSVPAAIGVVGTRLGLKHVLAQAKNVNKPMLTERNFNKLIPEEPDAFRQLALEAKRNLKAFIRKHFYLVESQKRKLEALTNEEVDFVKHEIDKALEKGHRIRVEFRRRSPSVGVRFVSVQERMDSNARKICGSGQNENCKGHLCACESMIGNDRGGVIGYGDDCDILGG